ncbi:MAG: hypothetical protein A3C93_04560 [Candidatus Lloydbacteria bacterium RIFCSPHIGHO2_02_FULL_54_17]|uniref:Methyltransferase type 11 domain-containing protein n=1 Tax=Candidatus Lloydbacteria bacterium RIFCSPHIGHO2_02_FULL_54_17 TaxID=1798664 RepID=A0A1G2DHH3_9BACT|nr:MAG: hypothetical protein A2762_02690 [Candidatus Lloydbacteria bacterium RIFCSPHIGHO2_01_FULL_54_11]OGZ13039.1 MAG: hypothetical protein A3C93_04560 [Candidatus Lloydbacteria bacterium RIFCSPHIGHO2_02_FULL_54_17]OGZ13766.1 MAG: hypothetical protein A2948_02825 [Candidatus Lloydbacteria bacterium RIFCSPLOWO2_01_FULL_54_18]OGZ16964.1 MAG: hypothetical protein A3H76_05050 [Candidatus Lloydbacteria bacterium RIFCSPLOWO2_02_FULL_54_12]
MSQPVYTKLNLGCGEDRKTGYVNLDRSPLVHPDVLHDLNTLPYPFPDGSFELIEAFHVLEHLDRPFDVMRELHRLLKQDGVLHIKVPHFSRGFTHTEHTCGFDVTFPLYFDKNFTKSGYYGVDFRLVSAQLHWLTLAHLLPYMGYGPASVFFLKLVDKVISFFANLSPYVASRVWCFWVGGFAEIEFVFKKSK